MLSFLYQSYETKRICYVPAYDYVFIIFPRKLTNSNCGFVIRKFIIKQKE